MSALPQINNLDFSLIPAGQKHRRGVTKDTPREGEGVGTTKEAGSRVSRVNAPPPEGRYAAAEAAVRLRADAALARQQEAIEQCVLQTRFTLWDDATRGVPNPFIRSGLFSVKNGEKREYLEKHRIASLSNYHVEYTGLELQQDDLSVWMSLINLARDKPISDTLFFTGYQLVKDLDWRMHSDSYKRVKEAIMRLKVTGLEIKTADGKQGYVGSLIREFSWDAVDEKGNARWMVRFEPRITHLFFNDTTTLLEWKIRKAIGTRHTTALWLHAFYTSHAEPLPYSEEKLHELCRSGSPMSAFRKHLQLALAKLKDVGFLKSYTVKDGIVYVDRAPKVRLIGAK